MVVTQTRDAEIGQAPGDLAVVQGFVNTLDIERGTDDLGSPAALRDWLLASGLAGPGRRIAVSAADLGRAVALREALRGVLASHSPTAGAPAAAGPGAAAAELRKIAAALPVRIEVGDDGRVAPAPAGPGVAAALARMLLIVAAADGAGTWARLKVCGADDCRWAFYDRSPTRSAAWCSMRLCGSRAKSRSYRRRSAVRASA
jgi:predicted RNA-binding Zn ribbon-like protein